VTAQTSAKASPIQIRGLDTDTKSGSGRLSRFGATFSSKDTNFHEDAIGFPEV